MSCITEILKNKGEKEYLVYDYVAIEDGGNYKGYEWLIVFTPMGHRCGYAAIPKNHPLHNKVLQEGNEDNMWNDSLISLDVHGGITFLGYPNHVINTESKCGDIWIGFDANHAWDKKDYGLIKKLWPEKEVIRTIDLFENRKYPVLGSPIILRDKEYMKKECQCLIDQIY